MEVTFSVNFEDSKAIIRAIIKRLKNDSFEVTEYPHAEGMVLMIKKGGFRTLFGLSKGVTIHFDQREDSLSVEFSNKRWIDKWLAAGIGAFIIWPLLITSAVGAYSQSELPKRILAIIGQEVKRFKKHHNTAKGVTPAELTTTVQNI